MISRQIKKNYILKTIIIPLTTIFCFIACAMLPSTESRLINAIQTGDTATARPLIETSRDLNFITESDFFPLLEAAYAGDLDLIKLMISRYADINLQNRKGMTALMAATYHEHPALVEYLILQEADLSLKNFRNYTALHFAVDRANKELINLLLERTDPEVFTEKDAVSLLIPAIDNNDAATVAYLLEKKVSPETTGGKNISPLTAAAARPDVEIVRLLLGNGADVNAKDVNGCDTLWIIGTLDMPFLMEKIYSLSIPEFFEQSPAGSQDTATGKTRIGFQSLLKLLENIADAKNPQPQIKKLRDTYDFSFLYSDIPNNTIYAISRRIEADYSAITTQLLAAGADVNTSDKRERSILNILCSQKEKNIDVLLDDAIFPLDAAARSRLRLIIDRADKIHGALIQPFIEKTEINQPDEYGNTPLLLACAKNARNFAPVLIQTGANVNTRNKDGWTPLITAVYAGKLETARLLLEHGANVNTANRFGETAILKAVYNNDEPMVRLLLEFGADTRITNLRGDSPRSVAEKYGYMEILSIFGD